ncbi:MAG TPA: hypothetical protein VMZ52_04115 [Bryobacteraceae bacterium]|nr:hypothetical protein [Bryobacteraceae bacterium]
MNLPTPDEWKALASAEFPSITIFIPLRRKEQRRREEGVRLRTALQAVESKLRARQLEPSVIGELIEPISEMVDDDETWTRDGGTLVIMRSRSVLRSFSVPQELPEGASVADHFCVLPILSALEQRKAFYLLALSQNHVRLLYCTDEHSEEIPLPAGMPKSLEDWLSTSGPTGSNSHRPEGGGTFNSTTDRDKANEHLLNFFRVVNKGIFDLLKNESVPLVLAGVEKELALYRSVNTYAQTVAEGVHGAPDGLKGGEMHRRALEIAQPAFAADLAKALADFERLGGTNRTATDLAAIEKAAREGRVAHLLVAERESETSDDQANAAALLTLANRGIVTVAGPDKVPSESGLAAILRY